MVQDEDPEKRIAELERQLSELRGAPRAVPPRPQDAVPAAPQFLPGYQQWPPPTSAGSTRSRARLVTIALAVASLLVPVIVGAVWLFAAEGPFADPELHTPEGLNAMLTQTREQFGDTTGYSLTVRPDYATLTRPDPQDDRVYLNYIYRGDDWTQWTGPSSKSSFDYEADLGEFDVDAVLAQLPGAAQKLTITRPEDSYLTLRGAEDGGLEIRVHVSGGGLSGSMELNRDGAVETLSPPT